MQFIMQIKQALVSLGNVHQQTLSEAYIFIGIIDISSKLDFKIDETKREK